ncbi:putative quinol monooxygenase [Sphingobacterium spiritivorum]|uniref:putative quinol monooxygenase n=1 Tax=Sphingobacterium spiritivorum TaxID=258 RepID=UPI001918F820|nr:putative quinol monooxygenase [Sphingobacterium spiritivorum]QQT25694.1 antibiotic biosynthesis monooxygenase [Sphingobacterium spiritivorum]
MNIYLTAVIKAKSEYRDEVLETLKNMVSKTLEEKACQKYDLHEDMEDPNRFVFYEIWQDQQGLDIHNQQPYILDFVAIVPEKLQEGPLIIKMKKLG